MNQQVYKPKIIPEQFCYAEIPCFTCGKPVRVHLNSDGLYVGCVYCDNCMGGSSAGTEQFSKTREF